MVLRYLRAHRAEEPEDLLGEVFVQVVRKFADFEGNEQDFRAWIFMIARNRLIDEWRRRRRKPVDLTLDDLPASAAPVGNSEDDAMCRLADQRVLLILERLSHSQRDILFLRIFGGLTVVEAARVIGKTPGAVKSLQVRGLAAIRREISKETVSL